MQLIDKEHHSAQSNSCRITFLIISVILSAICISLYLYLSVTMVGMSRVEILQIILFFAIQLVNNILLILYFTKGIIGSYLKVRSQVIVGTFCFILSIMQLVFALISYSQS